MTPAHPSRLAGALVVAALATALAPAPAADAARPNGRGRGALSPQLAELARRGSTARASAAIAADLSAEGPGGVLREGRRALVYVRFDQGAVAQLDALRAAGATIVDSSRRYQTITAAVKPSQLRDIAGVAHVASVSPVHPPIVAGAQGTTPIASSVKPCFGAATSEGDLQLGAMAARDGFELDGSGVEVGILSDSFNRDVAADTREAADIASGDLPGPGNPCGYASQVQLVDDGAPGEDEGRAMAQIVHDLAPGAGLAFATAFGGELVFAKNIGKLAEAGAKVIVDDVFYPEEPFFQDGPVAVAVNEAVEDGVTYLSAAGNDNLIDGTGRDIASWEAPEFRDSGTCPSALVTLSEEFEAVEGPGTGFKPSHCMDFNPGLPSDETFGITVSAGATLVADLQWAEPQGGVKSDIDAFLFSAAGQPLDQSIDDNASPLGTQKPVEVIEWENDTGATAHVRLVINRYSGTKSSPLKFALLQNGGGVTATEYPESSGGDTVGPTIFGHSGATSATSVGAVPFFDSEEPERYSSRGPLAHYFGPVNGTTPAEPVEPPEAIAKPDVAATDGGANSFFGACVAHTWRFFGTSAAAPHAAAVAALELEGKPLASPAEVSKALTESASPVGAFPPDAVGGGLVNAPEAIASLTSEPFPGGVQFAQLTPQNCGFPPVATPGSSPVVPPTVPGSSAVASAPQTSFRRRPRKVVRTHERTAKAVFAFRSSEAGATFVCRVDGGQFHSCPERLERRFAIGRHSVKVAAQGPTGVGDPTPAVYRFRVKQVG